MYLKYSSCTIHWFSSNKHLFCHQDSPSVVAQRLLQITADYWRLLEITKGVAIKVAAACLLCSYQQLQLFASRTTPSAFARAPKGTTTKTTGNTLRDGERDRREIQGRKSEGEKGKERGREGGERGMVRDEGRERGKS